MIVPTFKLWTFTCGSVSCLHQRFDKAYHPQRPLAFSYSIPTIHYSRHFGTKTLSPLPARSPKDMNHVQAQPDPIRTHQKEPLRAILPPVSMTPEALSFLLIPTVCWSVPFSYLPTPPSPCSRFPPTGSLRCIYPSLVRHHSPSCLAVRSFSPVT